MDVSGSSDAGSRAPDSLFDPSPTKSDGFSDLGLGGSSASGSPPSAHFYPQDTFGLAAASQPTVQPPRHIFAAKLAGRPGRAGGNYTTLWGGAEPAMAPPGGGGDDYIKLAATRGTGGVYRGGKHAFDSPGHFYPQASSLAASTGFDDVIGALTPEGSPEGSPASNTGRETVESSASA